VPKDTLGEFEFLVMLAAVRLGEDAYAVPIIDDITERTGRTPSRASVYVTLRRLEEAGLVESFRGAPLPERGGKSRRYVRVLPPGREMMARTRASLRRMWDGLDLEAHS
jgi:DNA-binding PadR family transcriptional regulator